MSSKCHTSFRTIYNLAEALESFLPLSRIGLILSVYLCGPALAYVNLRGAELGTHMRCLACSSPTLASRSSFARASIASYACPSCRPACGSRKALVSSAAPDPTAPRPPPATHRTIELPIAEAKRIHQTHHLGQKLFGEKAELLTKTFDRAEADTS